MRAAIVSIAVALAMAACTQTGVSNLKPQKAAIDPIPGRLTFQLAGNTETLTGEMQSQGGCPTHTLNYDVRDNFEKAMAGTVGQRFSVGPNRYDVTVHINRFAATYEHTNQLGNAIFGLFAGLPEFKVATTLDTVVTVRSPYGVVTQPISARGLITADTFYGCANITDEFLAQAMDKLFIDYVGAFDRAVVTPLRHRQVTSFNRY